MLTLSTGQCLVARSRQKSGLARRTVGVAFTPVINGQRGEEQSAIMAVYDYMPTPILQVPAEAESVLVSAVVVMSHDLPDHDPEKSQIELSRVTGGQIGYQMQGTISGGQYEPLITSTVLQGTRLLLDFTGAAPSEVVGLLMAYVLPFPAMSIAPTNG